VRTTIRPKKLSFTYRPCLCPETCSISLIVVLRCCEPLALFFSNRTRSRSIPRRCSYRRVVAAVSSHRIRERANVLCLPPFPFPFLSCSCSLWLEITVRISYSGDLSWQRGARARDASGCEIIAASGIIIALYSRTARTD